MRLVNGVVAFLFLLGVVVQYNDPDPIGWMVIYSAGVAGCVAWEADRAKRAPLLAVAGIAAAWALWVGARTNLDVPLWTALRDWQMHSGGSEEAREAGGLLIIAVWMATLALVSRGRFPDADVQ